MGRPISASRAVRLIEGLHRKRQVRRHTRWRSRQMTSTGYAFAPSDCATRSSSACASTVGAERFVSVLVELQDLLGGIQDSRVAVEPLRGLAINEPGALPAQTAFVLGELLGRPKAIGLPGAAQGRSAGG